MKSTGDVLNIAVRSFPLLVVIGTVVLACGSSGAVDDETFQQEPAFDFSKAVMVEVRNARGEVVLKGNFTVSDDDNEVERKARLTPTGIDADASGEAEIAITRSGSRGRQEFEISVSNLQPAAVFTFLVDGRPVATVRMDARGRAKHERTVTVPIGSTPP